MAAHKFRSNLWHNHDFSAAKPTRRFYPQVIHGLFQSSFTPCRGIPTKTPTVQKPCIDLAGPNFSRLHNEKERQILRFNALLLVHLQGLEPWAHWLRETKVQQSSIFRCAQVRCFYRFTVNSRFASAAFFASAIPSCIRYPAVPVCKKCAKMCRAKISPLKQASDFYARPGNRPGSSPIRQR